MDFTTICAFLDTVDQLPNTVYTSHSGETYIVAQMSPAQRNQMDRYIYALGELSFSDQQLADQHRELQMRLQTHMRAQSWIAFMRRLIDD